MPVKSPVRFSTTPLASLVGLNNADEAGLIKYIKEYDFESVVFNQPTINKLKFSQMYYKMLFQNLFLVKQFWSGHQTKPGVIILHVY